MKEGLIGVIVPVYKVEKYITECIESILAQTYTNFRLILVDDSTPDNAGKICDEYAKKDSRITVIHQENAGVTRARARGVEEADDCEFITFVDSDDTLPKNCFKILHESMSKSTDIVVGNYTFGVMDGGTTILSKEEYLSKLICMNVNLPQAMWGKLIRRGLFTENVFDIPQEIKIGEDTIANIRLAINSNKEIVFVNKCVYNYNIYDESSFHSFRNSLTYQSSFFKILKESIPEKLYNKLQTSIVSRKLWNWKQKYLFSYKDIDLADRQFIDEMKKDITNCSYRLSIFERTQLYCPFKLIKQIFIVIHKFTNIFKNL